MWKERYQISLISYVFATFSTGFRFFTRVRSFFIRVWDLGLGLGFTVGVCFVAIALVGTSNPNLKGLGFGPTKGQQNPNLQIRGLGFERDHGDQTEKSRIICKDASLMCENPQFFNSTNGFDFWASTENRILLWVALGHKKLCRPRRQR